jgi:hypothetical protein
MRRNRLFIQWIDIRHLPTCFQKVIDSMWIFKMSNIILFLPTSKQSSLPHLQYFHSFTVDIKIIDGIFAFPIFWRIFSNWMTVNLFKNSGNAFCIYNYSADWSNSTIWNLKSTVQCQSSKIPKSSWISPNHLNYLVKKK